MRLTYPSKKVCPKCGMCGYVWYLDDSEYVAKCINCRRYFRIEDFQMCVLDKISKPKTNADRIRAMSDDELAEFLGENDSNFPIGDHKKTWLDWLKKEV